MQLSPTFMDPSFHGVLGQSLLSVACALVKWLMSDGSGRVTAQMLNSCIFQHGNAPILHPAMQVAIVAPEEVEDKQPQKAAPRPTVPQQKSS